MLYTRDHGVPGLPGGRPTSHRTASSRALKLELSAHSIEIYVRGETRTCDAYAILPLVGPHVMSQPRSSGYSRVCVVGCDEMLSKCLCGVRVKFQRQPRSPRPCVWEPGACKVALLELSSWLVTYDGGKPHAEVIERRRSPVLVWGLFTVGLIVAFVSAVGITLWVALPRSLPSLVVAAPKSPTVMTVFGELVLVDRNGGFTYNKACTGSGQYSDIHSGTTVTVSAGGRVLVTGRVNGGVGLQGDLCTFSWAVVEVPRGHGRYAIAIPDRGEIQVDEEELIDAIRFGIGLDDGVLSRCSRQAIFDC